MIKIKYRIPKTIHAEIMTDMARPHDHAYERIGFLFTKSKSLKDGNILITAVEYKPVAEKNYIHDEEVGARINSSAIREAMQHSMTNSYGVFHVHLHAHKGKPSMSWTDEDGIPPMVESFVNVSKNQCHGIIILSRDSAYIDVKVPGYSNYMQPEMISIVGYPSRFLLLKRKGNNKNDVFSRQSFLGEECEFLFANVRIGLIGYGGGGSHIGIQLAHIGLKNITVFDDDHIEASNLNRLVGAYYSDLEVSTLKSEIAKRTIENVLPNSNLKVINSRWQDVPEHLQDCDIVIGCVDSFAEREQLEAECRRYLIPLIDIGMDVHKLDNSFSMSGQVILSMPGGPCMRCLGFLTDEKLAKEAAKYGNVGGRPQVVWPNGILASTAVGIAIDVITGWTKKENKSIYLTYDGNNGTLKDHVRLNYTPPECSHYLLSEVGEPRFIAL